jgi:hypothetical protein
MGVGVKADAAATKQSRYSSIEYKVDLVVAMVDVDSAVNDV